MDRPRDAKRRKLTPIESEKSSALSSSDTTEKSVEISTDDSPILRLPQELLSAIIDYVPKTQWPSLEFVNRSFRDGVHSSWQSMKEFDIGKDSLDIRQSVKGIRLSDILPSILAKLLLRSPMLQSIIGFPEIYSNSDEAKMRYRLKILQIMRQFTNLKRIDFGACGINSMELMESLTSSASRDRLKDVNSSAYNQSHRWVSQLSKPNWPAIFTARESSESHVMRLKLEKLSLKNTHDVCLDPRIVDLIDLSSLNVLVLDGVAAPSDYLLSLITNCSQLQQLHFSFMKRCPCKVRPCAHSTSSKQILDAIPQMESLDSLKIGMINPILPSGWVYLDDIEDDLRVLIDRLGRRGRLVEFGLLGDYSCSDEVIVGIGQHLTGLKSLELGTPIGRPTTLVDMIKKMVNLEKLSISGWSNRITSEVLAAVASHLQNLRIFHLSWSCYIDDLNVLTSMEHLEELSIVGSFAHEFKWESAFGHQLQSLELRNCHQEFVAAFLNKVPGLRRLVLSNIPEMDKVLRMIPMACPRLRELQLLPASGFCGENMKDGVQSIIDGCLELENFRC